MGLLTLPTIFQEAFPAYEQTHPLPVHVRRAARAIMQCRTAALGGHIQACPACGQLLVCTGVIPRGGAPPSGLVGERAA